MKRLPFFTLPFFAILLLAIPAPAQERTTPQIPPAKTADRPFADVPDEFFIEADAYSAECEGNFQMRQYYNCECMGFEFLSARIKSPEASSSSVALSINRKCIDATEAAGIEYNQCLGNAPLLPANVQVEPYCECYARTYAKMIEDIGGAPGSDGYVEFASRASIACSNPDMARQLGYVAPGNASVK